MVVEDNQTSIIKLDDEVKKFFYILYINFFKESFNPRK